MAQFCTTTFCRPFALACRLLTYCSFQPPIWCGVPALNGVYPEGRERSARLIRVAANNKCS